MPSPAAIMPRMRGTWTVRFGLFLALLLLGAAAAGFCAAAAAAAQPAAGSAAALLQSADADRDADDLEARAGHLAAAAAAARRDGDRDGYQHAAALRARLLGALGAWKSAFALLREAEDSSASAGARAAFLLERASLEVTGGRLDQAERTLAQASRLAPRAPDPRLGLRILESQAGMASLRNHDEQADFLLQRMRAEAHRLKLSDEESRALVQLGRSTYFRRDLATSDALAARVLSLPPGAASLESHAEALLLKGKGELSRADFAAARADLAAARAEARAAGASIAQAAAEQALGDCDARERHSGSAERWYALASSSLERAEGERWKERYVPGPPWLGPRAVLRRRLNLALWERSPERAWKIQEEDRARALLRALTGSATNRLPLWRGEESKRAHELADERLALLRQGRLGDADWNPVLRAGDSLQDAVRERLLRELHLEAAAPSEVREALPNGAAMLGYLTTPSIPSAWLLTRDSLVLIPLGRASELGRALSAASGSGGRRGGMPADSAAEFLRARLIEPVLRREPEGTSRLIVVPDGPLLSLGRGLAAAAPGAQARELAWAPSASSWGWASRRGGPGRAKEWLTTSSADSLLEMGSGGAALLVYPPGARISDRRPEQSEIVSAGAERGSDTTGLGLQQLWRKKLDARLLVLPRRQDAREGEGTGLGSIGLAYASLVSGCQAVAIQVGGGRGRPFAEWLRRFEAGLEAHKTPAAAAAGASGALESEHGGSASGEVPVFAVFGPGAFETLDKAAAPARARSRRTAVEPWVLVLLSVSLILAVAYGARSLLARPKVRS